jgi:hypothetical protein
MNPAMPKILEDRVNDLMKKRGMSQSQAFAIATASLQKEGKLRKGSQKLTKKGK